MMRINMQPGGEPAKRVALLLRLTSFRSNTKAALMAHFVNGQSLDMAAYMHDMTEGNLQRAINRLNDVAAVVEEIKELDWRHLK